MTDLTFAAAPNPAFGSPLHRLFRDAPVLTGAAMMMAALTVPTLLAMGLDPRQFQMENVWIKPLKFQVALAVYLFTLAVYSRWLPDRLRERRAFRIYSWAVVIAIAAEMAWIAGAAAHATASHFNTGPLMGAIYGLMGLLALLLTSAALVFGIAIWRNPETGLSQPIRLAVALGLVLTLPLTVLVAGYLSGTGSHFVGTPVSHAAVPVMGWSREVGDLRIAHFLATHALHIVPLAALTLPQSVRNSWVIAIAYTALTLAVFTQALAGLPLIPA